MTAPEVTGVRVRHEFQVAELVPAAWLRVQPASRFVVYNPTLTRFRDRLLMAYRVDFGYEKPFRVASALCVLDEQLRVVPGSVVALSDTIASEAANHYDARFLVFQDRLFVHCNNDWNTVPNQIFLVELDPDTLAARGAARPLTLEGPRQPCEKNWLLFGHAGELFAIYQLEPHIVLRVELAGAGPVRCWPVYRTEWETTAYTQRYGVLRGGTPPVKVGENYISMFHSRTHSQRPAPVGRDEPRAGAAHSPARAVGTGHDAALSLPAADWRPSVPAPASSWPVVKNTKRIPWVRQLRRWLRERFDPVRYYGGVYAFAAAPPFAPVCIRPAPILWPEREGRRQRPTASHMAPRRVVYPCGLVRQDDGRWLVAYGVHDERAVLCVFTRQEIEGSDGLLLPESPQ